MTDRSKVFVIAHLPTALEKAFIQHVRNFDIANADCHFEIGMEGPERPLTEMLEAMRCDPELTFTKIFSRK